MAIQTAATMVSGSVRASLEAQGYGTVLMGFDNPRITLYSHKKTNLFEVGQSCSPMVVTNPRHLNDSEARQLGSYASRGFFRWQPGEECLERTMYDVKVSTGPGGRPIIDKSDPQNGCRWCRERSESQGEVAVSERSENESSFASEEVAPSPGATVKCEECGDVMSATGSSGKPRSEKQQLHALTLHKRKHE